MFDPFVAEVAALNPTFAQPVASSIPSGDVTGGRPSRSLFKEFFFIVRKSFLYLAFGAKFLYNVFLLGEERLRRPLPMMGPHGFEKHSIVLAKVTNTVSRYSQEGTI